MNNKREKETKNKKSTLDELESGSKNFRPSSFMRARRPEMFSDSEMVGEPLLTREVFEYHLDTLTNRKQEVEFEHFSRRLAERELCPNLAPQTGPTGGGDSKVDAETYPIADELTLRWYEGIGREAGRERWAFAFSAKKAWRPKVRSDVAGIVGTNRGYKLIYFVTNQFVRDKAKAELEGELARKHGVDVRILDRGWIVKCVFENNRLRLAAETLKLTPYNETARRRLGPIDAARQAELEELDQQVADPDRYQGIQYQLAEDCLQTALLARGLELPRTEVEGRFSRAERIAERVGLQQQRLRVSYERAWTAYWWYDDFGELNRLYDQVEEFAAGSLQATDLEFLGNLWQLLNTTVAKGKLDEGVAKLEARTARLRNELKRLSSDRRRQTNALLARTTNLLMDLSQAGLVGGSPDSALEGLRQVLLSIGGLVEFPTDSITQLIRDLGKFYPDNDAYDALFDVVVRLTWRRASEGEAGLVLLQRGYQKLEAGKKYDAIRLLGQAQQKLAMTEYRPQWRAALAGCGWAYEAAGLLWAARANMLTAVSQAMSEFMKNGQFVPRTLSCLQKLIWLELQLGRVPCVLSWIDLASLVAHQLRLEGDEKEAFIKERETQDLVLALLFLKTDDVWELKWLDFLPQVLKKFGLDHSWIALLYALGHEDYLRSEGAIPDSETPEAVRELFARMLTQPANDDLPDKPELLRESNIILRSYVLGSEVTVKVANANASIYLAETILGAVEAFLATSLDGHIRAYRSELRIHIRYSDSIEGLPSCEVSEAESGQTIEIRHGSIVNGTTSEERQGFRSWLLECLLKITFQIAIVTDKKSFMRSTIEDERGVFRALNFSEVAIALQNILGDAPKFRLSDWEAQAGQQRFPLRRNVSWSDGLKQISTENDSEEVPWLPGDGEPPDDLFGIDNLKHKDRRIFSLINVPLWDKGEWAATGYALGPSLEPVLVICFKNGEAGKQIFRELRSKVGEIDKDDQLSITIITGIDRKQPASYTVAISTNPKLVMKSQRKQVFVVSRRNRMDPSNSRNLNLFLDQYRQRGMYVIMPGRFVEGREGSDGFPDFPIWKRELRVCPAWQINENDPDVGALHEDDDPIIPIGIENAPVLRALQRLGKRKKTTKTNRKKGKRKRR